MGAKVEKQGEDDYHLIDEKTDPKKACELLTDFIRRTKKFPVIGLDTEWTAFPPRKTPSVSEPVDGHENELLSAMREPGRIRNPVAILQLATKDGPILLIRLRQIDLLKDNDLDWQTFFIQLKDLLSCTEILKVGVAIQVDTSHLYYDYGLYTVHCLDLQHIAQHYKFPKSGLAYLSKRMCNVDMPKVYAHRINWDRPDLSTRSLEYAAKDAKLGVLIFLKFMELSIKETKNYAKPVKNCADYINFWRYKIDVLYRHIYRPPPKCDTKEKRVCDNYTTVTVEGEDKYSKLLQASPNDHIQDRFYRTDKTPESKFDAKPRFYLCILIAVLIISLVFSIFLHIFQRKSEFEVLR